jgi:hypothetical protein
MSIVVNGETMVAFSLIPDTPPAPCSPPVIVKTPITEMAQTASQAAQGQETVQMNFPKDVLLTVGVTGAAVQYRAGINPVPIALSTHWWLEANGVTPA